MNRMDSTKGPTMNTQFTVTYTSTNGEPITTTHIWMKSMRGAIQSARLTARYTLQDVAEITITNTASGEARTVGIA